MKNSPKNELIFLREEFNRALILNPTENIPWRCAENILFTEGLYIPEDDRNRDAKVCFGGRSQLRNLMTSLYTDWEKALGATASSFKLYSGLHAHIILFMSIANIGDKVLILPENGGGHYATAQILRRLGLSVKECIIDENNFCIDVNKTKDLIVQWSPDFIFIDRSDGLYYEDFSWMNMYRDIYKIFDASQYLSHILAEDYQNPFDMGMDLILTSLHKNYPGPQKAAFFTRKRDSVWMRLEKGLAEYVSNSHPMEIFKAVLTIPHKDVLKRYSHQILQNTSTLETRMMISGVPVIKRNKTFPMTQQIWIPVPDEDFGYNLFKRLEQMRLLTNYRTLPYNLGRGLRIGSAAATRQGLTPQSADLVGNLIAEAYYTNCLSDALIQKAEDTIAAIKTKQSSSFFTEAL